MDFVTHTLFGLTIYGATNKEKMTKDVRKSVFVAAVVGSVIPDIDVVSQLWDTEGMYQMWHRGITHSIFMVPIWAALISLLCYFVWKTKDKRIFYISCIAVFVHNTSDILNAYGTGYFEPFSSDRIGLGILPIVDIVIWLIMLGGFLYVRFRKATPHKVYKVVWLLILTHVLLQSIQGYMIYQSTVDNYEKQVITSGFLPGQFKIVGKTGNEVEVFNATIWEEPELIHRLTSQENVDVEFLFEQHPAAKTLYEWSPFVIIVEDEDKIGLYDPRFFRLGEPFLYEYIFKEDLQLVD
ncbi:metal-dependent hydrolase [Bacillus sp. FJAT-45350]|uniref:metal-dependent hydrolase n=1 Tax=Bacillus sp. FJAT-45350 TaxID=2011014 RepID=UPI000BB6D220|nr:metal-dependent hydrolase [Bacillus sp. FJAT-45350]